jgi:hypothetical protein
MPEDAGGAGSLLLLLEAAAPPVPYPPGFSRSLLDSLPHGIFCKDRDLVYSSELVQLM